MKCYKCGGNLKKINTDMPFKVNDNSLVVIKQLPVLQCENCNEYLIEDNIMQSIDELLKRIDKNTELEILRFAI